MKVAMADIGLESGNLSRTPTTSRQTGCTSAEILASVEGDWQATKLSWPRKAHIIIAGFSCTFNGNMGSSMPSGALDAISLRFGHPSRLHLALLNSLYMAGFVCGPLIFGPLSEYVGRRPVLIGTFLGYLTFMLACSGAPNFSALLVFRLLCGINAAAPTAIISGLYADILDDPSQRGRAIALYMTVTTLGPLIGPVISGFSSTASWRWPFWAAALVAVPAVPVVLTIPETFAPVLRRRELRKRNAAMADQTENLRQEVFNIREIWLRPFHLLLTEPVLLSTSLYLALAYSIFYLMFQSFPIIFQKFYGLAPGRASLLYIPMMIGILVSLAVFSVFNWAFDHATKAGKPWTKNEVYRRLPAACLASPCMVIGLFWLGWTVQEDISPVIPSIAGLLFGLGFQLVFMSMSNYITDIFRDMSASAHAAASTTRSIGAVFLPLAAPSMYESLGLHWAPSLLGFVTSVMGVIPFIFMRYGDALVRRSRAVRLDDGGSIR